MKALSTTKVIMFILCVLSVFAGTTQAATLFSDGFESGNFTTGGWSERGYPYTEVRTDSAHTGTYGARLAIRGWIIKEQSTVGYSTIHVKYWRKISGLTSPEALYVDWSTDGTTWTELEHTLQTSWASKDWTLPSGADNNAGFRIRYRIYAPSGGSGQTTDLAYIDDVEITGTPPLPVPGKATSPSPADTAINVGVTTDLSWTAGSDATSHNVYFGTTNPPAYIGEQDSTTYDTGTMSNNTTYYWRIDEKNASGTTTGDVWSFTTNALVPNVLNMTEAAATTAITGAGLVLGTVTYECSNTVAAGLAISQIPAGGTQVDVDSSVDLVISTGQPSVPNVTGQAEATAIAAITAVANISYGSSTTECSDTVAAGNVISQSATGTVTCGTVINLVVSNGPCLQTISGYVVEIDGNTPVKDVLMSAGDTNTLTDTNGYYEFSVSYGWSGIITPEKEGYVFEPNSSTYDNVTQDYNDANYTAALKTFKISGYVLGPDLVTPISDVNVSAENGGGPWTSKYGGGSWMTDVSGYYEVWVDYNWSGKVTPAKYAYAFEPNSTSYENVNVDYTTGQDYAGTLLTFKISGYIRNECSMPIGGVLVSADNGGGHTMTDANGFYEVWVSYAWSGTVTPEKLHYTFNPVGLSYIGVLVDQAEQNYTADNIYDLDCDGSIGWGDVGVMADNWLITGSETPIPGDFDADGTVNFADFAEFAAHWLEGN